MRKHANFSVAIQKLKAIKPVAPAAADAMAKARAHFAAAATASGLRKAAEESNVTPEDRVEFKTAHGDQECSLKKDGKGYYVTTHRARSPSYPRPSHIPRSKVEFVSSTS